MTRSYVIKDGSEYLYVVQAKTAFEVYRALVQHLNLSSAYHAFELFTVVRLEQEDKKNED